MKSLFSLSSSTKVAKAAAVNSSSSKKKPVPKEYSSHYIQSPPKPTKTDKIEYKQREADKDEEELITPKKQKFIQKNENLSFSSAVEESPKQKQPANKKLSKMTKSELVEKYTQLCEQYQALLEKREENRENKETTLNAIKIEFSNQMKLEKGVVPDSMVKQLDEKREENAEKD